MLIAFLDLTLIEWGGGISAPGFSLFKIKILLTAVITF